MDKPAKDIQNIAQNAMEEVRTIVSGGYDDTLDSSAARLTSSIEFLSNIVGALLGDIDVLENELKNNSSNQSTQNEEETKLLGMVEKWRGRYQSSEEECKKLKDMLVTLKEKYEILSEDNEELRTGISQYENSYEKLSAIVWQVSGRLDKSITTIDKIIN